MCEGPPKEGSSPGLVAIAPPPSQLCRDGLVLLEQPGQTPCLCGHPKEMPTLLLCVLTHSRLLTPAFG